MLGRLVGWAPVGHAAAGLSLSSLENPVRRTTLAAAALIPACALALTACGSKSGSSASAGATTTSAVSGQSNASLSQAQLLDHIKSGLASATAVHMKGTINQSGGSITIDMQVNKGGSAKGTMSEGNAQIPLIAIGSTIYIQLTPSYINTLKASMGSSSDAQLTAELVDGKWIKEAADSSDAQGISSMTDWSQLTQQWGTASGDTFTYLSTTTLNGQQVAQYNDVSTSSGTKDTSVLSLPATGAALPIQVAEKGSNGGAVTFTWSQPTTVTAPPSSEILVLPTDSAS